MPIVEQPEITLVSTTESQAELDHATGPNWRERFDPAKAAATGTDGENKNKPEESTETKDDSKTAAASDAAKPASKTEDDEPLPKGVQKRIDRITARLKEAEDELARSRSTRREPEAAKPASAADPEPALKDFKTWEEWNAAHNRWLVRDENRKTEATRAEEQAKANSKAVFDAHVERVQEYSTAHPEFEDDVKAMPAINFASNAANIAFQHAVVDDDNSAALMHYFATHPEEAKQLEGLSPVRVQKLVGRISEKVAAAASTTARTTVKTRTPAPTTPLRGTTTAPASLDDPALVKDTDSWIAKRQAQMSQKRRAH
jgi:hypothetical protein